jgi:PAS domain S-box-containing protein
MDSPSNSPMYPGELATEPEQLQKSWTLSHGLFATALIVGSVLLARHNYLAFHTLAELFSIVVAAALFLLVWHGRRFTGNNSLVALGVAFFFAGLIDLMHTLAYKGLGVFELQDQANAATQLWISARWLESLSILAFVGFMVRPPRPVMVLWGYAIVTGLLLWTIFASRLFPDCYITGSGLTPFKIGSEYAVCLVLAGSLVLLLRRRQALDLAVVRLLAAAILAAIVSELSFTLYVSVYGVSNLIGHLFKIVSFYLVYLALVRSSLTRPYETLFRELTGVRQALQRKVTELDTILEATADGILAVDESGKVLHANQRFRQLWGIPKELLESRNDADLLRFMLDQLKEPQSFEACVKTLYDSNDEESTTLEFKDGRMFERFSSPLLQAERISGRVWSFRDVTARKRLEIKLAASESRLRTLIEEAPISIMTFNEQAEVDFVNKYHITVFAKNRLEKKFFIGRKLNELPGLVNSGRISEIEPVLRGRSVDLKEVYIPHLEGGYSGYQRVKAIPFIRDGKPAGGLLLREDITERKHTEQALREGRDVLNRAQAVAHVGSWRMDVRHNELLWSEENHRIFGIPKRTPLTYETFLGTIHPDDRDYVDRKWKAALRGEPYNIEHRIIVGDSIRWVREQAELEFNSIGEVLGGFGTTQDITEMKQAEESLRRSIRRFEILAKTSGELLKSTRPQTLVESLCREVMEYLDCQAFFNFIGDERVGRLRLNAYAGIPPEEAARIEWLDYGMAVCGCAARDACRIVAEHIPTTPDARTELVKSYGIKAYACHPLLGMGGKVMGTLSFGTKGRETFSSEDLSLMKAVADQVAAAMIRVRNEQSLQKSEERLRHALHGAQAGAWERDVLSNQFIWSPENYELYGLDHNPDGVTYEDWQRCVYPEDIAAVDQAISDAIARRTPGVHVEFRIMHPRKGTRWLMSIGRAHCASDGSVARLSGINLDVTGRKELEAALRDSERALRQANQRLEERVKERTETLAHTVDTLKAEIAQRQDTERSLTRANEELQARTRQLRALASQLTLAEHRERTRLSRVLHDHLQQQLAAAKLHLSCLLETDHGEIAETAVRVDELLAESIKTSRSLAAELSPPVLHQKGIAAGFKWLADWLGDRYRLRVDLDIDPDGPSPDEDVRILLFESTRELLFNAVKHAKVDSAKVVLRQVDGESIQITISDEGVGFDNSHMNRPGETGAGMGIFSIAERLSVIGGRLEINSTPGHGSRFVLTAPLRQADAGQSPMAKTGSPG